LVAQISQFVVPPLHAVVSATVPSHGSGDAGGVGQTSGCMAPSQVV
jgi:hypothetical protein